METESGRYGRTNHSLGKEEDSPVEVGVIGEGFTVGATRKLLAWANEEWRLET